MTTPPDQPGQPVPPGFPPTPPGYGPPPPPGYGPPGFGPPGFGSPPPYGAPPPPSGQPWQGYPAPMSNGFGVTGLVLGIVSLVFGIIPFAFFLAIPLGVVGLVFAVLGRARAKRGQASNGGMATAGMVCSILAIVASIAWIVVLVIGVGSTHCERSSTTTDSGTSFSFDC